MHSPCVMAFVLNVIEDGVREESGHCLSGRYSVHFHAVTSHLAKVTGDVGPVPGFPITARLFVM